MRMWVEMRKQNVVDVHKLNLGEYYISSSHFPLELYVSSTMYNKLWISTSKKYALPKQSNVNDKKRKELSQWYPKSKKSTSWIEGVSIHLHRK